MRCLHASIPDQSFLVMKIGSIDTFKHATNYERFCRSKQSNVVKKALSFFFKIIKKNKKLYKLNKKLYKLNKTLR